MNAIFEPDPHTVAVSLHPRHGIGDVVEVKFTDVHSGVECRTLMTPELAAHISTLLATVIESPRISAMADQVRARQRDQ